MIVECPDCGGKIPDTESECPFCGCDLELCLNEPPAPEESAAPKKKSFMKSLFQRLFELILFLLFFVLAALIVLLTDFQGCRTELRRMCMTDSGTGSEADTQYLRIAVKHYILIGLDWIDHGGTGAMVTGQNDLHRERKPVESNVRKKVERPPLELPPDPPELQEFKDPTREYVIPAAENTPAAVPEQGVPTAVEPAPQEPVSTGEGVPVS